MKFITSVLLAFLSASAICLGSTTLKILSRGDRIKTPFVSETTSSNGSKIISYNWNHFTENINYDKNQVFSGRTTMIFGANGMDVECTYDKNNIFVGLSRYFYKDKKPRKPSSMEQFGSDGTLQCTISFRYDSLERRIVTGAKDAKGVPLKVESCIGPLKSAEQGAAANP